MKLFIYTGIVLLLFGCSSLKSKTDFERASNDFNQEFPATWPPKTVSPKMSAHQQQLIKNILFSVSEKLKEDGVDFKQEAEKIIITGTNRSHLNQVAKELEKTSIVLAYDPSYFAKNPFSAGTFDENQKLFLLSHSVLKNNASLNRLLSHELVHVDTYKNRLAEVNSPFYCKFKGKQFEPHYLSCDEMNAYSSDLNLLINEKASKKDIKSKVEAAKMHTLPISNLIKNLNLKTLNIKDEVVIVSGANENGAYQIEFPKFVLNKNKNLNDSTREYLITVDKTAQFLSIRINKLEADRNSPILSE